MVKYASSLLVAALVAAPALAQSSWDEFDAREYDDLFTRHPDEVGLSARELDTAPTPLFARGNDFEFDDTFERRSNGPERGGALAARELDDLYTRALEQLETRSTMLSFFNFMRDGMKQVKQIAHQPPAPAGASTTATATKGSPSATPSKAADASNAEASPAAAAEGTPAEGTPASEPPADPAAAPADPSADGAPAAREWDGELWERAFDESNALYTRGYDAGEELYGREYADDAALYGRGYDAADEDLYAREYYDDEALYGRSYYDLD